MRKSFLLKRIFHSSYLSFYEYIIHTESDIVLAAFLKNIADYKFKAADTHVGTTAFGVIFSCSWHICRVIDPSLL